MPAFERVSAVVSITLIGLALYFVLDFPAQTAEISLFGSPLALGSLYRWLMVVLLAAMVMAGMDGIIRSHPQLPTRQILYTVTFWGLPGFLIVLATQTLVLAPNAIIWAISLLGVGILLWATIIAEYKRVPVSANSNFWPRLWQQFIGYTIALIFYILIYQARTRSAISATAIMVISGFIALALLRQSPDQIFKTWLFAAVIGLSLGQITWALNYWRTGALNAGLLLLLIFYVLVGIANQQLSGVLSRRSLWEFSVVSLITLVVIFNL